MLPQPDTVPSSLIWSQVNQQEYQLQGDGRGIATLKIDDNSDSSMTGASGHRRWVIKRTGLFRFSIKAYAECDGVDCATLVESGADEYTVSLPDRPQLRWKQTHKQPRQEWAFVDPDDTALIVFAPGVVDSEYQASVQVSATCHGLPNLDLLVLLGWYILVCKYRDEAWRSAIITAIAWGMS